jgi:CRISPR-associated endoribonuclease Cas6
MRIKINFTENKTPVNVDNQSTVNGYIHRCLGEGNKYHDTPSDYSISLLCGGKLNKETRKLSFKNGGYIIVSSIDSEFINKIILGVMNNPDFIHGMRFCGIEPIEEQLYNGWNHFFTLSPFLIKDRWNEGKRFVTLEGDDFEVRVESYLKNKLNAIDSDLDLSDFKVEIPEHKGHKVKKVMIKNVINHANSCQISIFTNKKVASILYNIGIGQSTGCGFGTIYKTENHDIYKW